MNSVVDVAKTFFGGVWDMMLKTDFPGLGISLASVAIGVFIMGFSIRLFGYITGFSGARGSDYGKSADAVDKIKSASDWKNRNKIGF